VTRRRQIAAARDFVPVHRRARVYHVVMAIRAAVVALALVPGAACTRFVDLGPRTGALADRTSLALVFQRAQAPGPELAYASLGGRTRDVRALGFAYQDGTSISLDGTRASYPTAGPDPADFHQLVGTLDGAPADDVVVVAHTIAPVLTRWSPDDTRLAYVDPATGSIAIVDVAAGATPTPLAPVPVPMDVACAAPAWSPDGAQLAFATGTGVNAYTFRDHGAHALVPDRLATSTCAPRWSPDGASIAYTADDADGQGELLIAGLDGAAPRLLASLHGPARPDPARWSPDGSRLAYVDADGDHRFAIRVVDVAGSAPRTLDTIGSDVAFGAPEWSPDGSALLYSYFDDAAFTPHLAVIAADGGPPRTLPLSVAPGAFYAWLPAPLAADAP
jgi:hypothetical protein